MGVKKALLILIMIASQGWSTLVCLKLREEFVENCAQSQNTHTVQLG